ncbi:MAG TPA: alpha-ketoglutarate-dependent dioxygenase AlkB [Aliidongia sp.]|uniref:alpha-ketoglutarate-dependent dioxygenase AlkB n=1 Tax=Aliidongia sp. TaxID=1914230 RepID=UPI002DDDB6F8|nr:alpha-ketoglutarate-dependent dioxygenase AlkB [Aliidongia sp.]HEV2678157.1 alpha-ketoglutarate-dependent dioxygenase AlkB [Aliidongia sp.]
MSRLTVGPGITLFKALAGDAVLQAALAVIEASPPRKMLTPGGKAMSVAMTNCGPLGWVTDRDGYRYVSDDPSTGRPWPAMPAPMAELAAAAAEASSFPGFVPEACLVNLYDTESRMGAHQDRDERDRAAPIVSVSFGLSARFRIGGTSRGGPTLSFVLDHGDVLVFGGPARLAYHGVDRVLPGRHATLGAQRINLTFRRVT